MELESATEHAHETIHEHTASGHGEPAPSWFTHVALSTLLMALLSALAALMAAISAHESLLERTQEILDFVELEIDQVEIEVLRSKHALLRQFEQEPPAAEIARVRAYEEDLERMDGRTGEEELVVRATTHAHIVFALAVTLLSVGITLGGMAIITRKRFIWIIGLVFGVAGAVGVVIGLRDVL